MFIMIPLIQGTATNLNGSLSTPVTVKVYNDSPYLGDGNGVLSAVTQVQCSVYNDSPYLGDGNKSTSQAALSLPSL